MKVFVIADTHFFHENIIKYCDRPFSSVEDMNNTLVRNWNEVVSNEDIVLHLGDVSLGKKEETAKIIRKLKGRKILIRGNHDRWGDQVYRNMGFEYVSKFPILYDGFYLLSHAPLEILSDKLPYMSCYGHVHNDSRYVDTENTKCFSVERTNYKPVLLYEKE